MIEYLVEVGHDVNDELVWSVWCAYPALASAKAGRDWLSELEVPGLAAIRIVRVESTVVD